MGVLVLERCANLWKKMEMFGTARKILLPIACSLLPKKKTIFALSKSLKSYQ